MKLLKVLFAACLLMAAGGAVAGKGSPSVTGFWEGSGKAVYPDGTMAEIVLVEASLTQEGHFIHGEAAFTVIVDEGDPVTQGGQMSAFIKGNKVTGTLGFCFEPAPECVGFAVFEGRLSGNTLWGTVRDLSDGSTSALALHRIPQ